MTNGLVLFDGVCNLCNGSVRFILRHDRAGYFSFASLQSPAGARALAERGAAPTLNSIVLIEDGRLYESSDAVLRIARRLGAPWSWGYAAVIVPRPLRNALYRIIARNRYRWFGRREACMLPTPELRGRFLD
ncbi:MAG TPA: thiol-disulfide oxidoreductase DCC family protein [Herpetosiphonaceae bacterium]|nr:thiol-disulfide oxidoreductase DCC family protein [Herpetosiphonaceae bacterium]